MPPRKRKAAIAAVKTSTLPSKKVRIGDTSTIDDSSRASTPSGRPRRSTSNDAPQYNFTRKKSTAGAKEDERRTVKAKSTTANNKTTGEAKRRGRPPKVATPEVEQTAPARRGILKSRRGQPNKSPPGSPSRPNRREAGSSAASAAKRRSSVSSQPTSPASKKTTAPIAKKRGRPKVRVAIDREPSTRATITVATTSVNVQDHYDGDEAYDENIQYWLMKAEPESRIEKGVDVKFSIDDLATKSEPEGWDGVRNPAARNNMRAMRVGDLAFFYHSNCAVPGIAGVMRIVEEHSIDESAFDPDHPYYDPKSTRDKPKWELVKVEFVKKFDELITLRELKSFAGKGGALETMQMLRQGRLSVSSVQPSEWQFILDLAEQSHSLGHPVKADGYESDTDGETDGHGDGGVKTDGETEGDRSSSVDYPVVTEQGHDEGSHDQQSEQDQNAGDE